MNLSTKPTTFTGMGADDARHFCGRWLPAWTGNRPTYLASFYTDDVYYCDGGTPAGGITGKERLLAYFSKLLSHNPGWEWLHRGSVPLANGFLNYWRASIPVGKKRVEADGVCTVQLKDGLIYRNEVFFDRHELLVAIEEIRRGRLGLGGRGERRHAKQSQ